MRPPRANPPRRMLKYALLSIVAAVAVSALLRVSQVLWSPLAFAIRFLCVIVMLGMAVLAFVFFQVAGDEDYVGGYILGGLLAFLCLSLLGRLFKTRTAREKPKSPQKEVAQTRFSRTATNGPSSSAGWGGARAAEFVALGRRSMLF